MTVAPRTPPGPPSPTGYSSALTAVAQHTQVLGRAPDLHPVNQPGHQLELAAAEEDAA